MSLAYINELIEQIEQETLPGGNTKERVASVLKELRHFTNFELKEDIVMYNTMATGIGKSITLPDGTTSIQEYAFEEKNLTHINFPSSLQSIGDDALKNNFFKTLIFNEGLTSLGSSCFMSNSTLERVELPTTLSLVPNGCFMYCKITTLILKEGLISIDNDAFYGNKLTSLIIPSTVQRIGGGAFTQGSNNLLLSVKLPPGCVYYPDSFNASTTVTGGLLT